MFYIIQTWGHFPKSCVRVIGSASSQLPSQAVLSAIPGAGAFSVLSPVKCDRSGSVHPTTPSNYRLLRIL
jgi:hypothetical protein